jgi:hypothetical protein
MKIALLIPDRSDRPLFLANCLRMMKAQTLQPAHIEIVNYPPESEDVDISQRYRRGYDALRDKGFDLIAFIENDDWYSPDYLQSMVAAWEKYGRPDMLGTCYTYYYHLELKSYFIMEHHQRSSAMNTMIKPDMKFEWPVDMEPFTDMWLWQTIPSRIVFRPDKIIAIGMKHGQGKTIAGGNHIIDERVIHRYDNPDNGLLKETLDSESFEFYDNYFK